MRAARAAVVLGLLAAVVAACGDDGEETQPLTVFGPWTGTEADLFIESMAPFERESGVDVDYIGSADFTTELAERVNDSRPPDVALVPQPGLIAELDERDAIVAPAPEVLETAEASLLPEVVELGVIDDTPLAVPYKLSVKSLVWYPPARWEGAGWEIPTSTTELLTLTRQLDADGVRPWCFGVAAVGADGWVITDWIEEIVLRQGGPEAYDEWVAGDMGFTDPVVSQSFSYVEQLLLEDGHVLGGTGAMVRTPVSEAILPMLEDPPACAMHRNASFTIDWLPPGTGIGPDDELDFFVLPARDPDDEPPLLVGVDLAVGMTNRPETTDLLTFLASPGAGTAWSESGGYLGGRIDEEHPDDPVGARLARLLAEADVVRVDGSDQMPPAFGAGTFYEILVAWVRGEARTEPVLEFLDLSRDSADEGFR